MDKMTIDYRDGRKTRRDGGLISDVGPECEIRTMFTKCTCQEIELGMT